MFPVFLRPDSPSVLGVHALILHETSVNGARIPFSVCVANPTTALYITFIYIRSYTMFSVHLKYYVVPVFLADLLIFLVLMAVCLYKYI